MQTFRREACIRPRSAFTEIKAVSISSAEMFKSLWMTGSKTFHPHRWVSNPENKDIISKKNISLEVKGQSNQKGDRNHTCKKFNTDASSHRWRSRTRSSWWFSDSGSYTITSSSSDEVLPVEPARLLRFAAIAKGKRRTAKGEVKERGGMRDGGFLSTEELDAASREIDREILE